MTGHGNHLTKLAASRRILATPDVSVNVGDGNRNGSAKLNLYLGRRCHRPIAAGNRRPGSNGGGRKRIKMGNSGNKNRKGRDIGYALAARSCEGANSVEACTVTAPDAITAFAVQTPTAPRRVSRFFRVWLSDELPRRTDHPAYFGLAKF